MCRLYAIWWALRDFTIRLPGLSTSYRWLQRAVPLYADWLGRLIGAIRGTSRKCLVLDLDNTLWGGVVGDDGLEGLRIGPGSAEGEAFLEIQRLALDLKRRGIILAVCSKNDEQTARSVFRRAPRDADEGIGYRGISGQLARQAEQSRSHRELAARSVSKHWYCLTIMPPNAPRCAPHCLWWRSRNRQRAGPISGSPLRRGLL